MLVWCGAVNPRFRLSAIICSLTGSAALAVGLSALQLLPAVEFMAHSLRALPDGPHAVYPFRSSPGEPSSGFGPTSLERSENTNRNCWTDPPGHGVLRWTPSLYLGGIILVLAFVGAGFRHVRPGGPDDRRGIISFVAGVGGICEPRSGGADPCPDRKRSLATMTLRG